MSVICSDKTGTLTRNEMMVKHVVLSEQSFQITGVGYEVGGAFGFQRDGKDVQIDHEAVLKELCKAALLCNDAWINPHEDNWRVEGDPMEGVLIVLAQKVGYDQNLIRKQLPRKDEIPFDAEHRFMATLHHNHENGEKFIVIKGAPEQIISMCEKERQINGNVSINKTW
ncbi:MAG TPA: cation-transporting P-type ATPase, partial [Candidatus Berkiella sp.]|nr:cation-transporting P-type ATPase [Candidatus Berkiella sp.]